MLVFIKFGIPFNILQEILKELNIQLKLKEKKFNFEMYRRKKIEKEAVKTETDSLFGKLEKYFQLAQRMY